MNKITVIQLLNKIANGEELPRKLKGNNHTYTLVENRNYEDEDGDILFSDDYFWCNDDFLNKELEITEDKEIEDIDKEMSKLQSEIDLLSNEIGSYHNKIHSMRDRNNYMKETLKDLRKAVNELKKGK